MGTRDQMVVRILMLVARILADDPQIKRDVQNLANHIQTRIEA